MGKSLEAFRTIGEVSDLLDVPKHVLRFWEARFPQIKPMKRGGGRRLYRPEDVALLRGIHHLLHQAGYTIKGVQKILREQGLEAVKALAASSLSNAAATAPVTAPPARKPAVKGATLKAKLEPIVRELESCLAQLRGETATPARATAGGRRRA